MRTLFACSVLVLVACAPPPKAASDAGDGGATLDAGPVDSGAGGGSDAGGVPDGGVDAGLDAGEDAGRPDSGLSDSGAPDSGVSDSGATDAGGADGGDDCAAGFVGIDGGPSPTQVSSCRVITVPGDYRLTASLTAPTGQPCLNIHDTSNVRVDCGGKTVRGNPAVQLADVVGYEFVNCTFEPTGLGPSIDLNRSPGGAFHHSLFDGGYVNAASSNGTHVYATTIRGHWQQMYSSDTVFACNALVAPPTGVTAGQIISNVGRRTVVRDNTFDGQWDGGPLMGSFGDGADDGVVLSWESEALVTRNTFVNYWDCGIETAGTIENSVFTDNRIKNARYCGIGAWYWSNLRGCLFARNTLEQTRTSFTFFRIYGVNAGYPDAGVPLQTALVFQNNVFWGNKFVSTTSPTTASFLLPVFDKLNAGLAADGGYVVSGNVFGGNDFGTFASAPFFGLSATVPGMIVDDGGNRCPSVPDANYPLKCTP